MIELNALAPDEARSRLLACCGSRRWADAMTVLRPFDSIESMTDQAARVWRGLSREDWLEAFAAHPAIGDAQAAAAPQSEQASVREAPGTTLHELEMLNAQYRARFGYLFIICASGKSAEEMLTALRARLNNDPQTELLEAAQQQLAITCLRLQKLGPTS